MLLDEVRNSAYARAIKGLVGPETTVLDLGAGLGLLGLMAAKAGARQVYLVDPSPVLLDVESVIEANGLGDRVSIILQPIEAASLPEKVDVLVSVMTGNFLLQEDLLPTLFFARDRFLKSTGTLVPAKGTMVAVPVTLARPERHPAFRLMRAIQGLDYDSVRRRFVNRVQFERFFESDALYLAAPEPLATLDFSIADKAAVDTTTTFRATANGRLDGLLGWFDMDLGDHALSTGPQAESVHWKQAFMPLETPVSIRQGEEVQFSLNRPERGEWTWSVSVGGSVQRMSTFFGYRPDIEAFERQAPGHVLEDTPESVSARFVLERIARGVTRKEMERDFLQWNERHLVDHPSARTWLHQFLDRFSC